MVFSQTDSCSANENYKKQKKWTLVYFQEKATVKALFKLKMVKL